MNEMLRRVFMRLHYPIEVILVCVRWYVAYPLSLRHLEEMMAERGVVVDHSTIHRWAIKMLPALAATSITTFASIRFRNHSMARHSSRNLPLTLSVVPFCQGLPGRSMRIRFPA